LGPALNLSIYQSSLQPTGIVQELFNLSSFKLSATGIHYPNSAIDTFNQLNASPNHKTNIIILLEVSNAVSRLLLIG
jgi:hypothetical protein